jgi:hypothetical protein
VLNKESEKIPATRFQSRSETVQKQEQTTSIIWPQFKRNSISGMIQDLIERDRFGITVLRYEMVSSEGKET